MYLEPSNKICLLSAFWLTTVTAKRKTGTRLTIAGYECEQPKPWPSPRMRLPRLIREERKSVPSSEENEKILVPPMKCLPILPKRWWLNTNGGLEKGDDKAETNDLHGGSMAIFLFSFSYYFYFIFLCVLSSLPLELVSDYFFMHLRGPADSIQISIYLHLMKGPKGLATPARMMCFNTTGAPLRPAAMLLFPREIIRPNALSSFKRYISKTPQEFSCAQEDMAEG
ncbi:hypothetical protein BDQ17DRAFT_1329493 [Cyathus striatus]|nr:hypothetical protein BDQ17DRAFT_1329493 [Cyathus striatus]